MTTTYEIYTNDGGTPKAVTGNAPAIVERVENLENAVGSIDVGVTSVNGNSGDITPEQTGCLPLSGGTMTGGVTSKNVNFVKRDVTDSYITIQGGTSWSEGACLEAFGKDSDGMWGGFKIWANDGTNMIDLRGTTDGTLDWGHQHVLRIKEQWYQDWFNWYRVYSDGWCEQSILINNWFDMASGESRVVNTGLYRNLKSCHESYAVVSGFAGVMAADVYPTGSPINDVEVYVTNHFAHTVSANLGIRFFVSGFIE